MGRGGPNQIDARGKGLVHFYFFGEPGVGAISLEAILVGMHHVKGLQAGSFLQQALESVGVFEVP